MTKQAKITDYSVPQWKSGFWSSCGHGSSRVDHPPSAETLPYTSQFSRVCQRCLGCHGPHVLCKVTLRWHFGTQNMHPIYPWLWWKLPSSPCRSEPWDLFTYIYIQKGFLKTSDNEPDWASCPIPSQGSINYTFTPLFGINSNFSLSSDHNSLYFNTAINNQFEVGLKIF